MRREKVVLIGAGSAMFTRGLMADLIRHNEELDLALVDIDPDALAVAEGVSRKMIAARKAPLKLSAHTDRRVALRGATAVICTVGVGGRRAWEQDVFIPRKYGIYQPVGDSVMPGGTSRALRMIPAMVGIAEECWTSPRRRSSSTTATRWPQSAGVCARLRELMSWAFVMACSEWPATWPAFWALTCRSSPIPPWA